MLCLCHMQKIVAIAMFKFGWKQNEMFHHIWNVAGKLLVKWASDPKYQQCKATHKGMVCWLGQSRRYIFKWALKGREMNVFKLCGNNSSNFKWVYISCYWNKNGDFRIDTQDISHCTHFHFGSFVYRTHGFEWYYTDPNNSCQVFVIKGKNSEVGN